jgi:hypothetical protein
MGDTWTWDGRRWREAAPVTRPSARMLHAMSYDDRRQRVVLFSGGPAQQETHADTGLWDGRDWLLAGPDRPGAG